MKESQLGAACRDNKCPVLRSLAVPGCDRSDKKEDADGSSGILAYPPAGRAGGGHTCGGGASSGVLDRVFTLALEISRGSCLWLAHRTASHRIGFLCPGGAGAAQPPGTRLASADRSHAGVHF